VGRVSTCRKRRTNDRLKASAILTSAFRRATHCTRRVPTSKSAATCAHGECLVRSKTAAPEGRQEPEQQYPTPQQLHLLERTRAAARRDPAECSRQSNSTPHRYTDTGRHSVRGAGRDHCVAEIRSPSQPARQPGQHCQHRQPDTACSTVTTAESAGTSRRKRQSQLPRNNCPSGRERDKPAGRSSGQDL
jgi:hypothetical protein